MKSCHLKQTTPEVRDLCVCHTQVLWIVVCAISYHTLESTAIQQEAYQVGIGKLLP